MKRTKLGDRPLPDYTKGEEIFNMVSHIVGAAFGVAALALCVVFSALQGDVWAVVSSAIYGASLILLYTMSSVYHGLPGSAPTAKRVMQVMDHCTIYALICGSYTPILLCSIRRVSPGWGWGLFGVVFGLCALCTVFTAIDLNKYAPLSMFCYVGVGWSVIFAIKPVLASVPLPGILWLVGGGIAYSLGAVLYVKAGKRGSAPYMHSVFHLFVLLGSLFQFFCIFFYVI